MSAQTMADVFAPVEAKYREQVMQETWGHLAPKKNKTYKCSITWALGCFGSECLNPTVLSCEAGELDGGPWFYDALIDFLHEYSEEEGAVFRFDGTFRNYAFKGKVRRLELV